MQRAQILLRNLPPMLADILRDALSPLPDLELVQDDQLDPARPCVIVQGFEEKVELARLEAELAASVPSRRVIAIERDGRRGMVFELAPQSVAVGELSLDLVVDLITAAR